MIILIIVLVIIIALVIAVIGLYNNLVQLRNRVDNAWSQIDVQLQRRLDLIPNLVETVKGYAAHERGTFEAVTQARSAVMSATTPEAKMEADNVLTGTLKSLFAVAEAYPDLKANTNFQQLQAELTSTEDKISYMRQSYNDTVMIYNNAIQTFPGNIIAGMFGFTKRDGFDANAAASGAPVVSFGQGNAPGTPSVNFVTAPQDVPQAPSLNGSGATPAPTAAPAGAPAATPAPTVAPEPTAAPTPVQPSAPTNDAPGVNPTDGDTQNNA